MGEPAAEGSVPQPEFKKPVLVGRVGKLPRKAESAPVPSPQAPVLEHPADTEKPTEKSSLPPAVLLKELSTPIPYKEPKWSGLPPEGSNYSLEVIKSGVIVDTVHLMHKPFHVFGRLANCDVVMAHPTISRHHCVLQYKAAESEDERPSGWYVFDCASTHGTFLNKQQLKPEHYTRLQVGSILKLGCSTRNFILLGPEADAPEESELSITEMKKKHAEAKAQREREIGEAAERRRREREEEERKREESGVDWGMGDDAEDEPDLADNPFASTANEELYLDDPKKTLRGYFEREGLELQYDCQEKGVGQFVCRVSLPIEDSRGQSITSEVVHRGKKKEAVVACALEACRLLDRHGLLRQAKHESRRRKERDWSADDYYDSDEDTYLERTGAVERKRHLRMQRHSDVEKQETLTYDDLVKKCGSLRSVLSSEEKRLEALRAAGRKREAEEAEDLDAYVSSLESRGRTMAHRAHISKLKMEIGQLKTELAKHERLAELARPTHLPPLTPTAAPAATAATQSRLTVKLGSNSVLYGKRMRLKDDFKTKVKKDVVKKTEEEFVEEVDSDEEDRLKEDKSGKEDNNDVDIEMDNEKATTSIKPSDGVTKNNKDSEKSKTKQKEDSIEEEKVKTSRVFGPMRPPENYVMPENYLTTELERDCPDIMEDE